MINDLIYIREIVKSVRVINILLDRWYVILPMVRKICTENIQIEVKI